MTSEDHHGRRGWEAVLESLHPAVEPFTPTSRFGALGRLARRVVFRAARPVIFSEHQVHVELARAIESVGTQVGRVEWALIPGELDPGEVVDVQTDVGQLYLHRDDKVMTPFICERGVWEPEEAAFLRASLRPGFTFLDVGANVGYMSVLGGRSVGAVGRVIAIEPDSPNVRLLRANLWRNGVSASVLPVAAFSHRGFAGFVRSNVNRGDHQLHEGAPDAPLVPCSRLDDLLGPIHVDVAKIDTQGVDHEVLEGMTGLLRANPNMVVLSEFWLAGLQDRGIDPLGVLARYEDLGFAVGLLTPDGGVRSAGPQDVIDACQAWAGLFVNIILSANRRRPSLASAGHR